MQIALHMLTVMSTAALFGGMVLFASVIAPRIFMVLDEKTAGQFLRALFPWYYAFIIVTALLAAIGLLQSQPILAFGFIAIAISTLFVRQIMVPKINHWRDLALAGDTAAEKLFDRGHRTTVILNMVQLFFVLGVLAAHAMAFTP